MKIFKLTYGLMAATMLSLASCNLNEYPEFDDANAFVAIQKSSASVAENGDVLEIPVMLTSLSGIAGSVDFTITPAESAGAKEGEQFKILNDSKTLTFTKDAPTQYIRIQPIDNDTFSGDTKFTINLANSQGAQLGANKSCVVTIEDDEHPLSFILGTLTAKGTSYFNGEQEWEIVLSKDAEDLSKVKFNSASSTTSEIMLIGMTTAEAESCLARYLEDCVLAGIKEARIVHGKGTGALRACVHDILIKDDRVESFRAGAQGEGDAGVTIVKFR